MQQYDKYKKFVSYLNRYKYYLIIGAILLLVLSLSLLPMPLLTRYILDVTIPNKNFNELRFFIMLIIAIVSIQKILSYIQNTIFYRINAKIVYDIRIDLLKKINKIPLISSRKFGNGYLMSKINSDTGRLQSLFADTIVIAIKDILTLFIGIIAMFYLNWKLALMSILFLPFFVISSIYFSKKIKAVSSIFFENSAISNKQLEETLNMVCLVKQFSRHNLNLIKYLKKASISFRSFILYGKVTLKNRMTTGLISEFTPIVIIAYGSIEIMCGNMSIGTLIAFNSFSRYLFGPTSSLISINIEIQKALVAYDRLYALLNLPEEKSDKSIHFDNIRNIQLRNIFFGYDEVNPILKNLSFNTQNYKKIGIVGKSGSGKTTLLNLLSGLYQSNNGNFIINNITLEIPQIISLREHIALVEQEPLLFNDTIYNNIKLGKASATEDEILRVAKKAHVDIFVRDLKKKYNTYVGYKGNELSVGQKQRIAIARALLRNPKILLLDEATASLDNISKDYITDTINALSADIIVIISTHRLSTVKNCEKIFVMDQGSIVEEGSHNELISKKGIYFTLNNKTHYL